MVKLGVLQSCRPGHNWEESEQNSENIFLTQGDKSSPDPWGNLIWLATSLEAGWREHQTGEITYFTKEFPVTISQTNTSQILHKYSSKKFFVALSQPNTSQTHHKYSTKEFHVTFPQRCRSSPKILHRKQWRLGGVLHFWILSNKTFLRKFWDNFWDKF